MCLGADLALTQARRLLEPRAAVPAAGADALALAWALKELCYEAWSSNPPEAARAAAVLRQLLDAGVPAEQVREIEALAAWTAGIAFVIVSPRPPR